MLLTSFYQTMSQLCFTILGLWWVVVQTKHQHWVEDRARRRTVVNISLYFLLPGSMSLLAILSAEERILWRVAFAAASALGLFETIVLLVRFGRPPNILLLAALRWAAVPLYAMVALVALFPSLARVFGVTPLTAAATMLSLLVILGAGLALSYFVEPYHT